VVAAGTAKVPATVRLLERQRGEPGCAFWHRVQETVAALIDRHPITEPPSGDVRFYDMTAAAYAEARGTPEWQNQRYALRWFCDPQFPAEMRVWACYRLAALYGGWHVLAGDE